MAKPEWMDPEDLRLLLLNVRWMNGWSQERLARAAGVDEATVHRYENGRVPRRKDAEKIFAAAGRPLPWLEAVLLPGLRAARLNPEGKPAPAAPAGLTSGFAARIGQLVEGAQSLLTAGLASEDGRGEPARWTTAELRAILSPCTDAERQVLIERLPAYRGWATPGTGDR